MYSIVFSLVCLVGSRGARLQSAARHSPRSIVLDSDQQISLRDGIPVMQPWVASRPTSVLSTFHILRHFFVALSPSAAFSSYLCKSLETCRNAGRCTPAVRRRAVAALLRADLGDDVGQGCVQSSATRRSLLQSLVVAPSVLANAPSLAAAAASASAPVAIKNSKTLFVTDTTMGQAPDSAISALISSDIVLCGEHHNSALDHILTRDLLVAMDEQAKRDKKKLVLGMEMFERGFQSVLDEYVGGKLDDNQLYVKSEWPKRWGWDYKAYLPIFQAAKALGVKMLAVNTETEVIRKVPIEGLGSLSAEKRLEYVPSLENFVESAKTPFFGQYTTKIITASYGTHMDNELISDNATMGNFFAARILRDEAMATRMAKAVTPGTRGLLVVGGDHCKYRLGIEQRLRRAVLNGTKISNVMLNTVVTDTFAAEGAGTRLLVQADSPVLADYVLMSKEATA